MISRLYNGYPESRERFAIERCFLIIVQKLNIQVFGTYICLLFHIVAFAINALVPWHQFVYTLFTPCSLRQHYSGLHYLRNVYQQGVPSSLETGKSLTVPGPDCMEDARRCPNGSPHAARVVSAGQYADLHCRATEQFHAWARLFCKIT